MADSNNDLKDEIKQTVIGINEASRKGNIEVLKSLCHKNVVIVPPGFVQRAEGNDVMVLNRNEGKWLLIWRTLIPLAQTG